jgi:ATP-binding cassette subfamily B protein
MSRKKPSGARLRPTDLVRVALFVVRLAWRADRGRFAVVVAIQLVNAASLGALVLVLHTALGGTLSPATLLAGGDIVKAVYPVAIMLGLATATGILRVVDEAQQRVLALKVDKHITATILDAATRTELPDFEDPAFHDRVQRAVFAARMQPMQLLFSVMAAVQAFFSIIVIGSTLVTILWWLLPFVALAAFPAAKVAQAERNADYRLQRKMSENRRVRQYIERILTGRDEAKEVRLFGLGRTLHARWSGHYDDEIANTIALNRLYVWLKAGGRLASDAIAVALLGLGVWLVHTGYLPMSSAATVIGALYLLSGRVQAAGHLFNNVGKSVIYLNDLKLFTTAPINPPGRPDPGAERFHGLHAASIGFAYPGSPKAALRDVSITLDEGEIIALVGANGSGKTTLAKILAGLYEPDHGMLVRNGRQVTDLATLRDSTAAIFQDFVHYKISAAENIFFGRPNETPDLDGIVDAAIHAGAHDFINDLPNGYGTILGKEFSNGTDLSLGQWQRLALARAFYRDAPFIILDEPTASLDPQAEADLFARIRELFAGRTVLLISHRFSSVRSADRIYVLEHGGVIEHGTHPELIAANGTYARLFNLQAAAYLSPTDRSPSTASRG